MKSWLDTRFKTFEKLPSGMFLNTYIVIYLPTLYREYVKISLDRIDIQIGIKFRLYSIIWKCIELSITQCNAGFDRISGVKINERIFVINIIRYDFYNNIVIYYYIKSLIRFNDFHK